MSFSASTPKPILEALQAALASGPAQKLDDDLYRPRPQPYWYHNGSKWLSSSTSTPSPIQTTKINPKALRLLSWNIDMLIGFAEPRMSAALHHLSTIISDTASNLPVVIFLQEMTTSDLKQITETPWIQSKFYITEPDSQTWRSSLYGTTTLVDRRLRVGNVFRVPWVSKFERDGLFVNLSLSSGLNEFDKVLRLCNTHLESLVADPPVRPLQLQAAAPYLHGEQVYAAILAGDLNAIQPFDRTLHSDNNFKDAYLELGGQEDSDEGYTWGYQVPQALRERFGCSRMDKILFSGKVEAKNIMRIGMGVKVEGEQGGEMRDGGEDGWVTDHYGVMGDFELTGSLNLRSGDESDDGLRSKLA